MSGNTFPKLHNAMWPGLVGKGEEEPPIDLNKMLDMTQAAEVDGVKFDGVDLFLADPHTSIDVDDDGIKALADNVGGRGLAIGSAVAPVWPPVGGGSAMDPGEGRTAFLEAVRKACGIMGKLRIWACVMAAWCGSTPPPMWPAGLPTRQAILRSWRRR